MNDIPVSHHFSEAGRGPGPEGAPVLYHLVHGEIRGDFLEPKQANDQDPCPYVYATSNLREALPYMTPNGTRLVNAPIPGSEDFLTVIPDRENFMRNGKMQGTLLRFSGDGFEQQIVDGAPSTQWVSAKPVPINRDEVTALNGIEDAMRHGLHVLFTRDPMTDENYEQIQQMIYAPNFPDNLPKLVRDGVLIYENANPIYANRGIKPSPFFTERITPAPKISPPAP